MWNRFDHSFIESYLFEITELRRDPKERSQKNASQALVEQMKEWEQQEGSIEVERPADFGGVTKNLTAEDFENFNF